MYDDFSSMLLLYLLIFNVFFPETSVIRQELVLSFPEKPKKEKKTGKKMKKFLSWLPNLCTVYREN